MNRIVGFLFIVFVCLFSSCKKSTLFERISSSHSNINFDNRIIEDDKINPLDMINLYHGGGVGVGDFNNDGLQDIYFTGNRVSNELYLNKGNFKFEDITKEAGVGGMGRWGRGVAVVDINNDGLMDIYISNTTSNEGVNPTNILYINQGLDKNGVPIFKDMAAEYGLNIGGQSTMANFFDYDNDGDLDMYLTVNESDANQNPNIFRSSNSGKAAASVGQLYRNDWDAAKGHPVFHNVSKEASINVPGYGLSTVIADVNLDGWKDISVSNDYISSNILYINNQDGTFTDRTEDYFKHTSFNAMGHDIVDLNNDGLADFYELDMNPQDNYRKKMMLSSNSDVTYTNFDYFHSQYQYVRNTLQLNQGNSLGQLDSIKHPVFSEIGFLSGVAQTDWSWSPLVADFDNDGYRDVVVANGYPRDVTDHDFITYREQAYSVSTKSETLAQIPKIKIPNYGFRNNGDLSFSDATKSWGLDDPTFSNGAAYADLDNDGAMDLIVNNINDKALIYRNTTRDKNKASSNFLEINFAGSEKNRQGLGAMVEIFYEGNKQQVFENTPYRGYVSTQQAVAHFGLNHVAVLDSVVIKWPEGFKQTLRKVKVNQILKVVYKDAKIRYFWPKPIIAKKALFKEVTDSLKFHYTHKEFPFTDFEIQKLLPHKLSEYSPGLSVADVNGDGLDDVVVGGNGHDPAQIFLQQKNGRFIQRGLGPEATVPIDSKDEGMVLFDANGDGFPDLYIASGGYRSAPNTSAYQDRLYINKGKGSFKLDTNAIPKNFTSKLCVKAIDFNKDGKLDLFISGRVEPWAYPKAVSSTLLRNDSKNGKAKFTDVTASLAPALRNVGLVCDALFTDFDNDSWPDLILAGEWMPITFLKNEKGKFKNVTNDTGLKDDLGWWNSIVAGDFRHKGLTDYIVGNTGLNTIFQVSDKYPAYVTAKDFDNNGSYAAIPSVFFSDAKGVKREYPVYGRDDLLKQMISMKKKFTNYKSFANATMQDILTPEQLNGALRLKANMLQSCYLKNLGNGKFSITPLPKQAQFSMLNGMVTGDFDGDGNLDVVMNGNDYGTDVSTGRYDALNGLMLKGDGKGNFKPESILQSGIYLPGNGKALVGFQGSKGQYMLAASQNKGDVKIFQLKHKVNIIPVTPFDVKAMIKYKNGSIAKQEFYYGSSFLSQSGRYLQIGDNVVSVEITNSKDTVRKLNIMK
ncbi:hypothetical protein ABIB40_001353 [Pedobacter sp. UYP30]|uniref:VCBS repeat-containing protein n=1 Tax=Pedobacter sp. UYP30 TaxID=1756400 RepID=UPI00339A7253